MTIGHIELFVRDPMKSLEFYRTVLGFELITIQQDKFVWLKMGEVQILLRPGANLPSQDAYNRAPKGIVLYTDQLATTMALLKSRGLQFRGNDGSEHCPTFTDPDGHWFQLVNPAEH